MRNLLTKLLYLSGIRVSFKPQPYSLLNSPVHTLSVKRRISSLKDVFLKVESIHGGEYERFESELSHELKKPEDSDYSYYLSDSLRELDHDFYRVHRISMILSLYAYLENSMMTLCEQRRGDSKFSVKDLSGSGIRRCKTFLETIGEYNFSDHHINPLWSKLTLLNNVRNSLAHTEGYISEDSKLKKKTIEGVEGLYFEDSPVVMIDKSYVLKSMDTVEKFLLYLCVD